MNKYTRKRLTTGLVGVGLAGITAYAINDRYNEPGRGEKIEACPIWFKPNVLVYDAKVTADYLLGLEESKRVDDVFANETNTPVRKLPDIVKYAGEIICSEYDGFSGLTTNFLSPSGEAILIISGVTRAETDELPNGMRWFTRPEQWRNPLDPILKEQV